MVYKSNLAQPDKDAGWGLIFRLNYLWDKVDRVAEAGDYVRWTIVLDRIFANLSYRHSAEVINNDDGSIKEVNITDEQYKTWKLVRSKTTAIKTRIKLAIRNKNKNAYTVARVEYYEALMFYDIWLRKTMQDLGLYLKENESNPSKAMFGNAFNSKGR